MRISAPATTIAPIAVADRPPIATSDAGAIWDSATQRPLREPRIEHPAFERAVVPRSSHFAINAYRVWDAVEVEPFLRNVYA